MILTDNIQSILNSRNTLDYFVKDSVYRLIHGAADGYPGWFVDRFGPFLLSVSETKTPQPHQKEILSGLAKALDCVGIYHKPWKRSVRGVEIEDVSPTLIEGNPAPEEFEVIENGLRYAIRFSEGYSVGLFHDQRDNRKRLLSGKIAYKFQLFEEGANNLDALNTFSYTCAFSVCAGKIGMQATSLDWSRKYLDWGRSNFALNQVETESADFIYGDAREWMRRLERKDRRFDLIILDPPSFSKVGSGKTFQVKKDYTELVQLASQLMKPRGILLACCNLKTLSDAQFFKMIQSGAHQAHRSILQYHIAEQPADFPTHQNQPAHLKSIWTRLA